MASNYMTYKDLLLEAILFLENQQDEALDINAPQFLIEGYHHWSLTDYLAHEHDVVPDEELKWFQSAMKKLLAYYPAQYILGETTFYGRSFKVNDDVLIPRPETEWIVDEILRDEHNQSQRVVDLGTGSGCIGITLKLERPKFQVTGLDISVAALEVAKINAQRLDASVQWIESSLLQNDSGEPIDIFVSNPPYIAVEEQEVMDESVKRYEPEVALYAEHQGLAIYEQLAHILPHRLAERGRIYMEIGYQQGAAIQAMYQTAFPNKRVEIKKDLSGNDRLLIVREKEA